MFALACKTEFKKEQNKTKQNKKDNLGTWGKYSLHWLQIAIYFLVSFLFWLLILSNMLGCTNHKTEGWKRSFEICICYVASSVVIWNNKAQGLKYKPEFCCSAFPVSILSMCLFNHWCNGVLIGKKRLCACVCAHACVSGGGGHQNYKKQYIML